MHNENEIQEIIYPPFDEKYYTAKAKEKTSIEGQEKRGCIEDGAFGYLGAAGPIGLIIGLFLLPFIIIIYIASFFVQITETSQLAYQLYVEDCKTLQNQMIHK